MIRHAPLLGLLLLVGCESTATTPVYVDAAPRQRVYAREPQYREDRVYRPDRVRRRPDIELELSREPDYDAPPRRGFCRTPDSYDSQGRRCGRRAASYYGDGY